MFCFGWDAWASCDVLLKPGEMPTACAAGSWMARVQNKGLSGWWLVWIFLVDPEKITHLCKTPHIFSQVLLLDWMVLDSNNLNE